MIKDKFTDNIVAQIEKIFLDIGFTAVLINGQRLFNYDDFYCKVSYTKQLNSIVIETAENRSEVLKNRFEDSDVYGIDENTDTAYLLESVRRDLFNYYI